MKPEVFLKVLVAATLVILLTASSVSAANWYIATNGLDSNAGTQSAPFATLMQAQSKASSGDTVFINGGTYYLSVINSLQDGAYETVNLINKNGITYQAVAGTRPVFNFSLVNPTGSRVAAFWVTASHVIFQGFDVVAVQETITNVNNQSIGFAIYGGSSCTWNQVNVHNGDCVGFYFEKVSSSNLVYQCDSYNNTGIDSGSYGNADGFGCHISAGGTDNVFRQCRSWNNSDDGYDCINAAEPVTFDHCWSYMNGNNGGNANGFKVGGWGSQPQDEIPDPIPTHIIFNCLSADNGAAGFYANHQPAGPGAPTGWTNNTAYYDNIGFNMLQRNPPDYATNVDETDANDMSGTNEVMHNNLVYADTYEDIDNLNETGSMVESNSWTETGVTVSSADFQSLSFNQMTNARLANGALPVITFAHLVNGDHLTGLGCFVVPPVPTNLTATVSNTQVSLNWSNSTGAYGYNVYRSLTSSGTYTNIALWVTNNSCTDTGVSNGTTYYYEITAVNPGDESTNSVKVSATIVPMSPTGLTATASHAQVALSWAGTTGATSYNVKSSTTNGGSYATIASGVTSTGYTNTGLVNLTTYYYVVSAVNGGGESTNSSQASATPQPPLTPILKTLPIATAITYGQPLSSSTLSGGEFTNTSGTIVPGTFAFTTPSTAPNAGVTNVAVSFNPTDTTDYITVSFNVNVTVNQATPVLETSATATAITYGQPLSASTLSGGVSTNAAGATVSGTFAFATPSITPNAGVTNAAVSFTPTDTIDYITLTNGVPVTVNPLAVLLSGTRAYDGTTNALASIMTVANIVGVDIVTVASGSGELSFATVGTNPITSLGSLTLGGGASGNYTLAGAGGSVVIIQAVPDVSMSSSQNPSPYGVAVTFSATVTGADTPTGGVSFLTNGVLFDTETLTNGLATSVGTASLPVGSNTVVAAYSGDVNYLAGTNELNQVVKAPQFGGITVGGNGLVMSGSWGTSYGTYYILVSTNILLPLNQWTPCLTNQFDINGNFNFTNPFDSTLSHNYYILQIQ